MTEQEIMQKAYERYGTDIHSFGQQRDGYVEALKECIKYIDFAKKVAAFHPDANPLYLIKEAQSLLL